MIVTGAAQGIGFAIAQQLADSGAKVVVADVDEQIGKEAVREIANDTQFIRCDVASWKDQLHLFQKTVEAHGRIDLVVCNAAINPELMPSGSRKHDYLMDEYEENGAQQLRPPLTKIFDVNINGVAYNVKLAMHHMSRTGGGRIVVVGSAGSYIPVPDQALYCASKHAVLGLVRAVSKRKECLENGISVSLLAPWLTQTRMTEEVSRHLAAGVSISSPRNVAAAVANFVTQPLEKVHGKSIWVQGSTYTEVEDAISECCAKMML